MIPLRQPVLAVWLSFTLFFVMATCSLDNQRKSSQDMHKRTIERRSNRQALFESEDTPFRTLMQQYAQQLDDDLEEAQGGSQGLYKLWSSLTSSVGLGGNSQSSKRPDVINRAFMRDKIRRGLRQLSASKFNANVNKRAAPDAASAMDYTQLVNPFIGTGATYNPGNVFPGAAVPYSMAKFGIDVDEYAPAGYNDDVDAPVRGLSLLHDSGTGSSSGSYGNFESLPVICSGDKYELCPITLDHRKRLREHGKDAASPGYFTTTLNNSIQLETTTTRRAGLIRYSWTDEQMAKQNAKQPFVVFDWTNDLPGTFRGGEMDIDPQAGRIMLNGSWASSFGSGLFTYRAYACYDLLANGEQQIDFYGMFEGDRFGQDNKVPKATHASQPRSRYGGQPPQRGALISWSKAIKGPRGPQILLRAGVSFVSAEQACQNAEDEIPAFDFDAVRQQSKALWNEKLSRVQIANDTEAEIAELVYSSLYRTFLSPNNATFETQGLFAGTTAPFFDGLYCTWDTFRTLWPFQSLISAQDYADVVQSYVDGYVKQGFIPECRANVVPGFTQGGSDGTNVLADFAVKYRNIPALGVDLDLLYKALYDDATITPEDWSSGGRQIDLYDQYGYVPFDGYDLYSIGPRTREGSRTLEYAFNDFGIRNVAILLGKTEDAERWTKRALSYKNVYDKSTKSLGFDTFVQRKYLNGTFGNNDPTFCSPIDNNSKHACSLQQENVYGVYETSSWEYSMSQNSDFQGLIELLSGGSRTQFIKRLDTFFDRGLYYSGNEPSFPLPTAYSYANDPTRSVDRVRRLVYSDFNTTNAGLPGNDDNAAMASLLLFHLMGLWPIASTREFLVVSPFMPKYTLFNTHLGSVTITAQNFDKSSLNKVVPASARAYVKSVTINGKKQSSRCKILFDDLYPAAAMSDPVSNAQHVDIVLEMTTKDQITDGCGPSDADLPSSLSTGGFDQF